ncbi:hypothetical protein [Rothia terrae]|uniref:hypothetical protein n=1 Tax=Rothia terrae TaxID=396015 RepID=UPI00288255A0|nr:hypothetical protein [Rothia terrae]MDT0189339.1 hypothetical protein [Rothia terrae]
MTSYPENNVPRQPEQNPAQGQPYGHPQQNNAPLVDPGIEKDLKNAKLYGILSIVFSAISLLIFGFLALPGLIAGIMGLNLCKKLSAAGVNSGNSKTLNIIGIVIGAIAVVLWILGLILQFSA